MRGPIRATLLASLLLVASCGGGGGGGGEDGGATDPDALLAGSYVYVYLDRDVAGDGIYSEVATFDADGVGRMTFGQGWQTGEGGPGAFIRRADSIFDVTSDRGLTIAGGFASQLTGAVSSGGTYVTASALSAGTDPGWFCAVRRAISPSLAEVVGTWRFVEWSRDSTSPDHPVSMVGRVAVDAGGNLNHHDIHYNDGGSIDPVLVLFLPSRFELGGPGGLRIATGPTLLYEGGMSASGDVILLAERTSSNARVRVMVREGTLAGAASIQGAWRVSGYASNLPGYLSTLGSADFDGVADGTWSHNANLDGTPGFGAPVPIDYGVSITGQVSVLWSGVSAIYGGAATGFLVLGGPLTPTRGPCLYVLIR